jgi:hypothetical protein
MEKTKQGALESDDLEEVAQSARYDAEWHLAIDQVLYEALQNCVRHYTCSQCKREVASFTDLRRCALCKISNYCYDCQRQNGCKTCNNFICVDCSFPSCEGIYYEICQNCGPQCKQCYTLNFLKVPSPGSRLCHSCESNLYEENV